MGWISQRCARTGHSIGGTDGMKFAHMPLKKIVARLHHAESIFEQDWVELECGHQTHSNGMYRARCPHCPRVEVKGII